jgi:hypothetical protein
MSKHIFPHFYSLEAPVLWLPHRRKVALSRKHFRNAFLMHDLLYNNRPVHFIKKALRKCFRERANFRR